MEKNKQQANEAVTQRVYYWEYDDGSVAALQFDDDCKKATALHGFPNLYNMHSFFSSSSNSKDRAIEFIKRKLHVGIGKDKKRLFRNANADEESMREGFEELKKMITSHTLHGNNAQVMNLLSLAMAGYVSRLLISNQEDRPLYFYRAPIIHVVGHKKDPCAGFEYLERIIESLSVDTSWDNKQIMTNPSVIPTNRPVVTTRRSETAPEFTSFFKEKFELINFRRGHSFTGEPEKYVLPPNPSLYGAIILTWCWMHSKKSVVFHHTTGDVYTPIADNYKELLKFAEMINLMQ